jgi:3-phytase
MNSQEMLLGKRRSRRLAALCLFAALAGCRREEAPPVADVRPALATEAVTDDPDDPAIWYYPADPARSLIVATNKVAAPRGALVVYGLDGKVRQTIDGLDRPNNVDIEYGLTLGGRQVDVAVATERHRSRLRLYRIDAEAGRLEELPPAGGIPVFEGEQGDFAAPMGIGLYRRPQDGAIFAIVGRKSGPREGYLWQYRLEDDGSGAVRAVRVRAFGRFSGRGEIEAIAVDDELGYVYYADEGDGIHKWHADPDHPEASRELAQFGREGFRGDREGIGIYAREGGAGYVIATDQVEGNSRYLIFRREGRPGDPHDHSELVKVVRGGADATDGIEVTSAALGPRFPYGLLVAMNSSGKNFLVFAWEEIARAGKPPLDIGR